MAFARSAHSVPQPAVRASRASSRLRLPSVWSYRHPTSALDALWMSDHHVRDHPISDPAVAMWATGPSTHAARGFHRHRTQWRTLMTWTRTSCAHRHPGWRRSLWPPSTCAALRPPTTHRSSPHFDALMRASLILRFFATKKPSQRLQRPSFLTLVQQRELTASFFSSPVCRSVELRQPVLAVELGGGEGHGAALR